jgi:hypothetical protein
MREHGREEEGGWFARLGLRASTYRLRSDLAAHHRADGDGDACAAV